VLLFPFSDEAWYAAGLPSSRRTVFCPAQVPREQGIQQASVSCRDVRLRLASWQACFSYWCCLLRSAQRVRVPVLKSWIFGYVADSRKHTKTRRLDAGRKWWASARGRAGQERDVTSLKVRERGQGYAQESRVLTWPKGASISTCLSTLNGSGASAVASDLNSNLNPGVRLHSCLFSLSACRQGP